MSGEGFGMPDLLSPVGALVSRTFDVGDGVAAADRDKIVEGSPVLAVFASQRDRQPSWIATGRALPRVLHFPFYKAEIEDVRLIGRRD